MESWPLHLSSRVEDADQRWHVQWRCSFPLRVSHLCKATKPFIQWQKCRSTSNSAVKLIIFDKKRSRILEKRWEFVQIGRFRATFLIGFLVLGSNNLVIRGTDYLNLIKGLLSRFLDVNCYKLLLRKIFVIRKRNIAQWIYIKSKKIDL